MDARRRGETEGGEQEGERGGGGEKSSLLRLGKIPGQPVG